MKIVLKFRQDSLWGIDSGEDDGNDEEEDYGGF